MKFDSAGGIVWYLKYFGLPLALCVTICKVYNRVSQKKRRATLKGKVVLITGASSGIGEALAHAFYEQGSKVILAARREPELDRVKSDLVSKKLSITTQEPVVLRLDLADLESLSGFAKQVHDVCGPVDILINNGGISHRDSILHTRIEVDKQIMYVNYFGPVCLTKALLPKMVERKSGHIVLVSSVQGLIAIPDRSAYAASKFALQAFGDALRSEMHQHKINVSVVSPGYVKTAVSLNALTGSGEKHAVMDQSTAQGFSAEYVADRILDTVVYKENDLVISQFLPKLLLFYIGATGRDGSQSLTACARLARLAVVVCRRVRSLLVLMKSHDWLETCRNCFDFNAVSNPLFI